MAVSFDASYSTDDVVLPPRSTLILYAVGLGNSDDEYEMFSESVLAEELVALVGSSAETYVQRIRQLIEAELESIDRHQFSLVVARNISN